VCQPRRGYESIGAWECCCGCFESGSFRRFISAEEELEMLEGYRDQLKKELVGVEECIQELKSE
jgi:hypothetical protein